MNTNGGFHEVEKDGKLFLVYYRPKYNLIPTIQGSTSSIEAPIDDDQPLLFSCPLARLQKDWPKKFVDSFSINSSPHYDLFSPKVYYDHHVLPLFWCNNKQSSTDGLACGACGSIDVGTAYYLCVQCKKFYHKECVESPIQIKHPYHPEHSLQLFAKWYSNLNYKCSCCGREASDIGYICTLCNIFIHPICVMQSIPLVIEPPKKHNHLLSFFPRQASLTCNVCGLVRISHPTYICARCNFVAHSNCMNFPNIIKISRHHHRISYVSSLQFGEWSCGVCRQNIDNTFGAYTCNNKCIDYVVHSKCAIEKDVWDGKELEGVPEEDDVKPNARSFDVISEGVIFYFLHEHQLVLKVNIFFDESKLCKACVLPIYEGNFYSCFKCDFILHETCANAPPSIEHALHPHPLTLKATFQYNSGIFECLACDRICSGFVYECCIGKCTFYLDVRCASITEPFDYKGHEHPLYLALNPVVKPICNICKRECKKQLNCIKKCDFIVCIKCATIPYKIKYKHDKHFLTFLCGKEVCLINWCELCEHGLEDTNMLYWCSECCTSFHVECLFREEVYLKPGRYNEEEIDQIEVQTLGKGNMSRPICDSCKNRCHGNIFKTKDGLACSLKCLEDV